MRCLLLGEYEGPTREAARHGGMTKPLLTITVEREETGAYFASWQSRDEGNGVGGYSATPIGAVANLLCTLILVEEDRVRDGEPTRLVK